VAFLEGARTAEKIRKGKREYTSKALRYGMRSQGISQFISSYRSSANTIRNGVHYCLKR